MLKIFVPSSLMGSRAKTNIILVTLLTVFNFCLNILAQSYSDKTKLEEIVSYFENHSVDSDLSEAFVLSSEMIELSIKLDQEEHQATGLNNLGIIYYKEGDFEKSIQYYEKSREIYSGLNDLSGVANVLNNLGNIHADMFDFGTAHDYYLKSLDIYLELDDTSGLIDQHNNIGSLYANMGYDQQGKMKDSLFIKAKSHYDQCLELSTIKNDTIGIAGYYLNFGNILYMKDDFSGAKSMYQKCIEWHSNIDNPTSEMLANLNLGFLNIDEQQQEEAESFLLKALAIAEANNFLGSKMDIYHTLYQMNKGFDNNLYAFKYYQKYLESKNEYKSEENINASLHQKIQYEFELKTIKDSITKLEEVNLQNALISAKKETNINIQKSNELNKTFNTFLIIGGLLMFIFSIVLLRRLIDVKKKQKIINDQKKLVSQEKVAIDILTEKIEHQHLSLSEKHKEIQDSINYAKRLQDSILPEQKFLQKRLKEHFVLFKPKDIVSGDFYWSMETEHFFYIAVADCTGHGVPGAMVSIVCSNALNRSIKEFQLTTTSDILSKSRDLIIETFSRSGNQIKDGMDISICRIDIKQKTNTIQFSGANNPLWVLRSNDKIISDESNFINIQQFDEYSIIEIKGEKQPVGLHTKMIPFTSQEIQLLPEDQIFLFTDGFADQFGGIKGKKIKYKPFKTLICSIASVSLEEQRNSILDFFNEWKSDLEQVDDVCIIGFKTLQ